MALLELSKWVILWRCISVRMPLQRVAACVDSKQQDRSLGCGSELMCSIITLSQPWGISAQPVLLQWHPQCSAGASRQTERNFFDTDYLNPQKRNTDGPLRCLGFLLQLFVQTPQGLDLLPITHQHLGHPAEFLFEFTLLNFTIYNLHAVYIK